MLGDPSISFGWLKAHAVEFGIPADTTSLRRWLERQGVRCEKGGVDRGQQGWRCHTNNLRGDIKRAAEAEIRRARSVPKISREGRYQSARLTLKAQADQRLTLVRLVRDGLALASSANSALVKVAADRGVPQASLKRWWKLVKDLDEGAWRDALVPAYKPRQAGEIDPRLWAAFRDDYGRLEKPQAHAVWERVKKLADSLGLSCPHEKTLLRRFRALPGDVQMLMREGERALKEAFPHQARDRSDMASLDSCNFDGREWDLFVMWPDGNVCRPVVTIAEDDASHFIVAYEVDVVESAAGYRRVFRQACPYGVMRIARFDNTRAAANKTLTAGAKGRKRFKDQVTDLDGLLKELGVQVSFAEVRNGRTKGAERVFAEIKERTEKHPLCKGAYTGRSPSEKPANYGESSVPLDIFSSVLKEEVERYNTTIRTRSTVVAQGTSYAAAFAAGLEKRPPRHLTRVEDVYFFRSKKLVAVNKSGEFFIGTAPNRHRYYHEKMMDFAHRSPGRKVVVRYDENDLSILVYVEDEDGKMIVEAVPRLEAGAFNSAAQAGEFQRAKKRAVRAGKEKLKQEQAMDTAHKAGAALHEPRPEAPTPIASPKVVAVDFASKPHQPTAEPEPETPVRDFAEVLAQRRASRGEDFTATQGPDFEKLKHGREKLARSRAG